MPVTPQQLLNDLTPEIESAIKAAVEYIDGELKKHFYGKPLTISHTPARLPIPILLFTHKIEQIYRQAGWLIDGTVHSDPRDGSWIEYKMQPHESFPTNNH